MSTTQSFVVADTMSADGTTITYRTTGNGPGAIVVPGAFAVAADLDAFARELGTWFKVHTIERRGRGTSGPQGENYGADRECEDIAAVQRVTQSRFIIGHSFGGFLTLEAMRRRAPFDGAAVYEPGVFIDGNEGPVVLSWASPCRQEINDGRNLAAFITFVRGVNPETTGKAPRLALRLILPLAIRKAERRQKYALLPATILEHEQAAAVGNQPQRYAAIETPTLLMAGKGTTNTGAGRAALRLARLMPTASLRTFPKLDHFGMEKDPAAVAEAVANFLLTGQASHADASSAEARGQR